MADMRVLNIEPGAEPPVVATPELQAGSLGTVPDCPNCNANHYMHETPAVGDYRVRCMECGTQYKLNGTQVS